MYTDVKEPEKKDGKKPYEEQENDNPLYEAADTDDAVLNPIYDRLLSYTKISTIGSNT